MKKEEKIEELVKKLIKAKDCYYNDQPIMSDSEFDSLEDELYELDPENYYFSIVGISIKGSNKIALETPMLSCGKSKTSEGCVSWLKKINCENEELVEMPKIDGMSGTIKYVNGELSYISTRGDGKIGQDISFLKNYLNIPLTLPLPLTGEARGEIYLPKNTSFDIEGKPLRNAAAGLVARKTEEDRKDCKYLKFVSYQSVGLSSKNKFSDILEDLKALNFDVVDYKILFSNEIEDSRLHYLSVKRNEWNYETDGLVLTINDTSKYNYIDSIYKVEHHHHYNIALKPPAEGQKSILRNIEWNVSKNGYIIPVAIFDPIYFNGRKVHRASLNNYGNVLINNLKEGDEIFITLNNDVIPFFKEKLQDNNGKSLMIDICPCCGNKFVIESNNAKKKEDEVLQARCLNKDCKDQIIKTITSFCSDCEMDGVSSSTISTLFENKLLHNIIDLYSLKNHREEILNINGFADSKVDNLFDQIEKSKKMNVVQFVSRIGIENIGEKGVINLGIYTLQDFFNLKKSEYVNGNSIIEFKKNNKEFIEELIKIINPVDVVIKQTKGKVCMTGNGPKKRNELISLIEEKGYEYVSSVNKNTSILICDDVNGSSSKLDNARKLGIKLMSYEDFFEE